MKLTIKGKQKKKEVGGALLLEEKQLRVIGLGEPPAPSKVVAPGWPEYGEGPRASSPGAFFRSGQG